MLSFHFKELIVKLEGEGGNDVECFCHWVFSCAAISQFAIMVIYTNTLYQNAKGQHSHQRSPMYMDAYGSWCNM